MADLAATVGAAVAIPAKSATGSGDSPRPPFVIGFPERKDDPVFETTLDTNVLNASSIGIAPHAIAVSNCLAIAHETPIGLSRIGNNAEREIIDGGFFSETEVAEDTSANGFRGRQASGFLSAAVSRPRTSSLWMSVYDATDFAALTLGMSDRVVLNRAKLLSVQLPARLSRNVR
jgi:hypothetical protein